MPCSLLLPHREGGQESGVDFELHALPKLNHAIQRAENHLVDLTIDLNVDALIFMRLFANDAQQGSESLVLLL